MDTKKIALVTGASRGIGKEIALTLAKQGYEIATVGKSSYEKVKESLKDIEAAGAKVHYVEGSLADEGTRAALLSKAKEEGKIELLVNNAGMAPRERRDVLEMTAESLREVLDTNLIGSFLLTQAVSRLMIEEKAADRDFRACIINISSISAYTVSLNRAEYCLSKAGISMMTEIFASRLAEYDIPVHEVRPGIILTDMTKTVREKYERLIAEGLLPIKRIGEPRDVAQAVKFLTSGELGYCTGQVIDVDGGFHIRRL